MDLPGVQDCAVMGKPDDAAGELPMAFVVKAPNSDLTADVVKNHVAPKVTSPNFTTIYSQTISFLN